MSLLGASNHAGQRSWLLSCLSTRGAEGPGHLRNQLASADLNLIEAV